MADRLDLDPQSSEARDARRRLIDLGAAYLGATQGEQAAYVAELKAEATRLGAVELGPRSRELMFTLDAASLIICAATAALAGATDEDMASALHRLESSIERLVKS